MKLSLVIPCYNEAKSLPALIGRCRQAIEAVRGGHEMEVVLVDNGSNDETRSVFAALELNSGIRSVRVPVNRGYGYGILAGLRETTGDVVGWTHADMQTDPMDAVTGFDFFLGSENPDRLFVKGRRIGRPLGDRLFAWGMSAFETALMFSPLSDINSQPNLMPRSFFDGWIDPPSDFSLDLFSYYCARTKGLSVVRFPVSFNRRLHGTSSWNADWKSKIKLIKRTISYSLRLRRSMLSR